MTLHDDLASIRAKITAALEFTPLVPPNADDATMEIVEEAWSALSDLMRVAARVEELELALKATNVLALVEIARAARDVHEAFMLSGDCRTYPLVPLYAALALLEEPR